MFIAYRVPDSVLGLSLNYIIISCKVTIRFNAPAYISELKKLKFREFK